LPQHKSKTVLRSRSSPASGGYNELSIEDRAGQELIYLRAQRDLEQLILNDSDTRIGNDRREQITRDSHSLIGNDRFEQVGKNSSSLIKGDELHTTQGQRHTMIGGDELISITGNSSTTASGTLVIQGGPQVHVTAANVVVDAGMSLTLKAGDHYIVINPEGIFSNVSIDEGGEPTAGIPSQRAVAALPGSTEALVVLSLAAQGPALIQAARQAAPICAVCQKLPQVSP
jgi:type VI secretion system secreted protein VgrG